MKILYFDTETTGTNPAIHEITQFAGIVEIDGVVKEAFNFRCQPTRWDQIDPGAIATTGVTIEELKTFDEPKVMLQKIEKLLNQYIPKYTKLKDKFYPAGHNVSFDLQFFDAFVRQHGGADLQKWGSVTWQNWRALDTRVLANFLLADGIHLRRPYGELPDVKLGTLCEYFSIPIDAHDALSDIRATQSLMRALLSQFGPPRGET